MLFGKIQDISTRIHLNLQNSSAILYEHNAADMCTLCFERVGALSKVAHRTSQFGVFLCIERSKLLCESIFKPWLLSFLLRLGGERITHEKEPSELYTYINISEDALATDDDIYIKKRNTISKKGNLQCVDPKQWCSQSK